jgi:hypothetical protein
MIANMTLVSHATSAGILGAICNTQFSNISNARNMLVREVKNKGGDPCTHLLWIDSDQLIPGDALKVLLSHDLPFVGAFYSTRVPPYRVAGRLLNDDDWSKGGLSPARCMPGGCCLVKMSVYDAMDAPWYTEHYEKESVTEKNPFGFVAEDENFSRRTIAMGLGPVCDVDLSYRVGHQGSVIKSLNGIFGDTGALELMAVPGCG